ncbi:MAG: hypothetical protein HFF75_05510 [Oscillospiraceae bacterium]|nr:hypothetical protein [Oscillospiraceae bacterium]
MRRSVSTNMIMSSLYVFCRACGSLHFTHHTSNICGRQEIFSPSATICRVQLFSK